MTRSINLKVRGVKKKTGELEPGNRGPGSSSGLKKSKTGYHGSDTRFLVPGFYRVSGNRVKYIFFYYFFVMALHFIYIYIYIYFFTFFFS
jgi:hypothetical protein